MKLFSCPNCRQVVYFESVQCTRCGRPLWYLPGRGTIAAGEPGAFAPDGHRACRNQVEHGVCNWAIPADDPDEYCRACRLNDVIPNLADAAARAGWQRLEIAKRRLIYTLDALGLPVEPRSAAPEHGLAFAFMAEAPGGPPVFTGHADGVITINVAEADDTYRERMRHEMAEPYRTLLGHFRHESGHYYWRRLMQGGPLLARFRERFGDERADYASARQRHYAAGPPADWPQRFLSAYASMHPWEDFAEAWAHYLHMTDTLETARAYGLALRPQPEGGAAAGLRVATARLDLRAFDDLLAGWVPVTLALNSLNRSMGLTDPYPFVLPAAAIEKLRFVHEIIAAAAGADPA